MLINLLYSINSLDSKFFFIVSSNLLAKASSDFILSTISDNTASLLCIFSLYASTLSFFFIDNLNIILLSGVIIIYPSFLFR